jgi:hypothetical protein
MWHGMSDFLKFLELVFNGEIWCVVLLEFLRLFLIEKLRWCDMLLEFSELFFNEEMWCDMR